MSFSSTPNLRSQVHCLPMCFKCQAIWVFRCKFLAVGCQKVISSACLLEGSCQVSLVINGNQACAKGQLKWFPVGDQLPCVKNQGINKGDAVRCAPQPISLKGDLVLQIPTLPSMNGFKLSGIAFLLFILSVGECICATVFCLLFRQTWYVLSSHFPLCCLLKISLKPGTI